MTETVLSAAEKILTRTVVSCMVN